MLASWYFLDVLPERTLPKIPELSLQQGNVCEPVDPVLLDGREIDGNNEVFLSFLRPARLKVCKPGTLSFMVRGHQDNVYPVSFVVTLSKDVLLQMRVLEPTEIVLNITQAGWIVLGATHYYFDPPHERGVWISNLLFAPSH